MNEFALQKLRQKKLWCLFTAEVYVHHELALTVLGIGADLGTKKYSV